MAAVVTVVAAVLAGRELLAQRAASSVRHSTYLLARNKGVAWRMR